MHTLGAFCGTTCRTGSCHTGAMSFVKLHCINQTACKGLGLDVAYLCLVCSQFDHASALKLCCVQGFGTQPALQAYNERLPSTWHIINHKVTPSCLQCPQSL